MKLQWGSATDVGKVRTSNEDALLAEAGLFAVADGMGGHNAGEVASALAITTLRAALRNGVTGHDHLRDLIQQANSVIYTASLDDSTQRGMGTTLTVVAVVQGQDRLVLVGNVGDSRTYLLRDSTMSRVTQDHSYVQELVNEGVITEDDARTHPRRNIVTRALGIDRNVSVDIAPLEVATGDRLLLCSDGLVDEVDDDEIAAVLRSHDDPARAAERLIASANSGGGRDNTSVVVVDVLADDAIAPVDNTRPVASPHVDVLAAIQSVLKTPARAARSWRPKRGKTSKRVGIGVVLFWAALAGIGLGVVSAVGVYARTGFFLDASDDGSVGIWRGRPGGILWFDPTLSQRTNVDVDDLPPSVAADVRGNRSFTSSSRAMQFLQAAVAVSDASDTGTTDGTTTTSSTRP